MSYDAVNMIHDVIRTANLLFQCTAEFIFLSVRNNKSQQIRD